MKRRALEQRFWEKVDRSGTDCWPWLGGCNSYGYGRVTSHRRGLQAHRVAYELAVGPIPAGLQLDHLCRNRACCNPAHLQPVTIRENVLRGETHAARNLAKTHCPLGHPYDEANTYRKPSAPEKRECRACWPIRKRAAA